VKGKGKVFPVFNQAPCYEDISLCLIKLHAVKKYCRVEVWLHTFLTLVLYGGEWLVSRPGRFTPERMGGPQSRFGRDEEK